MELAELRTACTSNMLSDTKLPDGTVGGLYHVKIRCTWYQMVPWPIVTTSLIAGHVHDSVLLHSCLLQVVETFLILDLIFTVPMMVLVLHSRDPLVLRKLHCLHASTMDTGDHVLFHCKPLC